MCSPRFLEPLLFVLAVTFTVPEKTGEHGSLCTFPGHWATIQGTMIVTEDAAA